MRRFFRILLLAAVIILFFTGMAAAQTVAKQESLALVLKDRVLPLQRVAGQFDPAPWLAPCGSFFLRRSEPDSGLGTILMFLKRFQKTDFEHAIQLPLKQVVVHVELRRRVPRVRLSYHGGPITAELWVSPTELTTCPCLSARINASLP